MSEYTLDEVHWIIYCEKRMTIIEGLLQRLDSQLSDHEKAVLVEIYRQHEAALVELGVIEPEAEAGSDPDGDKTPISDPVPVTACTEEDEIAYP